MKIIKISKHVLPNKTYICGECGGALDVVDVTHNPRHFFNPGQKYSCPCGKSQVWTNSVRYLKELEKYCDGEQITGPKNPEVYGFCNDKFCPKCGSYFSTIKNGQLQLDGKNIVWEDLENFEREKVQELIDSQRLKSVDIHGCLDCDNNNLVHQGYDSEGGEIEGQKLTANWYRDNQEMWR